MTVEGPIRGKGPVVDFLNAAINGDLTTAHPADGSRRVVTDDEKKIGEKDFFAIAKLATKEGVVMPRSQAALEQLVEMGQKVGLSEKQIRTVRGWLAASENKQEAIEHKDQLWQAREQLKELKDAYFDYTPGVSAGKPPVYMTPPLVESLTELINSDLTSDSDRGAAYAIRGYVLIRATEHLSDVTEDSGPLKIVDNDGETKEVFDKNKQIERALHDMQTALTYVDKVERPDSLLFYIREAITRDLVITQREADLIDEHSTLGQFAYMTAVVPNDSPTLRDKAVRWQQQWFEAFRGNVDERFRDRSEQIIAYDKEFGRGYVERSKAALAQAYQGKIDLEQLVKELTRARARGGDEAIVATQYLFAMLNENWTEAYLDVLGGWSAFSDKVATRANLSADSVRELALMDIGLELLSYYRDNPRLANICENHNFGGAENQGKGVALPVLDVLTGFADRMDESLEVMEAAIRGFDVEPFKTADHVEHFTTLVSTLADYRLRALDKDRGYFEAREKIDAKLTELTTRFLEQAKRAWQYAQGSKQTGVEYRDGIRALLDSDSFDFLPSAIQKSLDDFLFFLPPTPAEFIEHLTGGRDAVLEAVPKDSEHARLHLKEGYVNLQTIQQTGTPGGTSPHEKVWAMVALLNRMSDAEFMKVAAQMPDETLRLYLFVKYPDLGLCVTGGPVVNDGSSYEDLFVKQGNSQEVYRALEQPGGLYSSTRDMQVLRSLWLFDNPSDSKTLQKMLDKRLLDAENREANSTQLGASKPEALSEARDVFDKAVAANKTLKSLWHESIQKTEDDGESSWWLSFDPLDINENELLSVVHNLSLMRLNGQFRVICEKIIEEGTTFGANSLMILRDIADESSILNDDVFNRIHMELDSMIRELEHYDELRKAKQGEE